MKLVTYPKYFSLILVLAFMMLARKLSIWGAYAWILAEAPATRSGRKKMD